MPPNPCRREEEDYARAEREERDAWREVQEAQENWYEEMSPWDESTWATAGATTGVIGACVMAGLLGCGLAALGGAFAILSSEQDRLKEIEDAKEALEDAARDWGKARKDKLDAAIARSHCRLHHAITQ